MVDVFKNETLDDLSKVKHKIIQKKDGFRFSLDAILLANFIKSEKKINIADFGTGTGIMPLLIADKPFVEKIYGIEIQKKICEMAERSIKMNDLVKKVKIINKDIKKLKLTTKVGMVITNPPYIKEKTGKLNSNNEIAVSKHEIKINLEELILSAANNIIKNGKFNIVYRTNRFDELICILNKYGFSIGRIKFVYTNCKKNSTLFLLEATFGKSHLEILPPLYIYDTKGNYTKEVLSYY